MEVKIKNVQGAQIGEVCVDLGEVLAEAETAQGDPVDEAVRLFQHRLEVAGFELDGKETGRLANFIGDAVARGDFSKALAVRGKQMFKKAEANGKKPNNARLANLLEQMDGIFESAFSYPNDDSNDVYESLVGLGEIKTRLTKEISLLLSTDSLEKWSKRHHRGSIIAASRAFQKRPPLIIFGGDIGTGKTALAESFGDPVARLLKRPVSLLRISIETRGGGIVGEMTRLITKAFHEAKRIAQETRDPVILLLDEADSLAQSREAVQMHHEDRAGVNALIQGIDHLKNSDTPILVVFCTNRVSALDPAIKRRAAIIQEFSRPNEEQARELIGKYFGDINLTRGQINDLVSLALPNSKRTYGFTYSDLVTRLVPTAVLEAYPDKPLSYERIVDAFKKVQPTPPFDDGRTNGSKQ